LSSTEKSYLSVACGKIKKKERKTRKNEKVGQEKRGVANWPAEKSMDHCAEGCAHFSGKTS